MDDLLILICPNCKSFLSKSHESLLCSGCQTFFPIIDSIPRFVPLENYANSFGLQWNNFVTTQIDSSLGSQRSMKRFREETLWDDSRLTGKLVLDAGCGSGRFSEIALLLGARVIAVDYSSAVEAAAKNLHGKDILTLQADLANLPIASGSLDYIFCIGVLQHTEHPAFIVNELLRCLKPGGELTLTFYENSSWHVMFYSKYLLRPLTKRIPPQILLWIISKSSTIWFPITRKLFSLPSPLNRIFRFILPIANYVEFHYVNKMDARSEAILDTFDMLSPAYDRPIKKSEILAWIEDSGMKVQALRVEPTHGTMRFKRLE